MPDSAGGAGGGDLAARLQGHHQRVAEALAREHQALQELIVEYTNRVAKEHRELLAATLQELETSSGLPARELPTGPEGPVCNTRPWQQDFPLPDTPPEGGQMAQTDKAETKGDTHGKPQASAEVLAEEIQETEEEGEDRVNSNESARLNFARLQGFYKLFKEMTEPERTGRLAAFVDSGHFMAFTSFVIFFDQAVTVWSTNYTIRERPAPLPNWVVILEWLFLIVYVVEICLKVAVHRRFFFTGQSAGWNIFDTIVVGYSLFESTGLNLSFLRSLRVLKIAKTMRAFKGLSFVEDLQTMIDSLLGCFFKFVWSAVLLFFIFYIFALVFVQTSTGYILEEGDDINPDDLANLEALVGSVQGAIYTLYLCVTFGLSWATLRTTLETTGMLAPAILMFFQSFWSIAVMNIVTTVFLSRVIKFTQPTPRQQLEAHQHQNEIDSAELVEMLEKFGKDVDSSLSQEDLAEYAKHPSVQEFFAMRGLEIKDEAVFSKMVLERVPADVQPNRQQLAEVAANCFRMRGTASNLDLQTLGYELKEMHGSNRKMLEELWTKAEQIMRKKPDTPTILNL